MTRLWCGRACFPKLKPFIFGSVALDIDTPHHEVLGALKALWLEMVPIPLEGVLEAIPGALFFKPEEDCE